MRQDTDWSRRKFLAQTGIAVAGAAGLGAAGYTGYAATRSRQQAAGGKVRRQQAASTEVQRFVSRPDLSPPVVTVRRAAGLPRTDAASYVFMAPTQGSQGQGGGMITDTAGRLVWFSPASGARQVMNLSVQAYRGRPVLTWWQGEVISGHGEGVAVIADSSYRTVATVRAGHGLMADLHDFVLTPQGTALLTAFRQRPASLAAVGGPVKGTVLAGVAQEIDVGTGRVLFEWDSLDHVDVGETYLRYSARSGPNGLFDGTGGQPFDYFHINSLALAPDGDLIISARNTSAVYKVSRASGQVRWRLGGRRSSFSLGPGARFYWQHDVRPDGADGLTIFDDGAAPARERQSRGLLVGVDTTLMRATVRQQYVHPGATVLASAMGNVQPLPGGGVFVGWGATPRFSQFAADGGLLLDGTLPARDSSYRAFLQEWNGHPAGPPAVAARFRPGGGASVYASWNGATGIGSWAMLAGRSAGSLAEVARAPWGGFETALVAAHPGPYFAAEARDARGRVLGRSRPVTAA